MALGGCVGARSWLLAAGLAVACSGAAAQDKNSEAVPVEAAKVVAAPLSEQVTAVGTLLSNEAFLAWQNGPMARTVEDAAAKIG